MAKGYPDYFGQSAWPKYGPLKLQTGLVLVAPFGLDTDVFSLTMQGIIAFGYVQLGNITAMSNVALRVFTEGDLTLYTTIEQMYENNYLSDSKLPVFLELYDCEGGNATIAVSPGSAFSTSYRLVVRNFLAVDVTVAARLNYYQII